MGLVLVALLLTTLVVAAVVMSGDQRADRRSRALEAVLAEQVRRAVDVAYDHLELSSALADALLDATGELDLADPHQLRIGHARMLEVAREHRRTEPDLAVIVIDTLRRDPGAH